MGMRAEIFVLDENYNTLVDIYVHWGELLEKKLGEFLENRDIAGSVDPFNKNAWKTISAGMDDLAAQLVWYLKKDNLSGGVRLMSSPLKIDILDEEKTFKDLQKYRRKHWLEYAFVIYIGRDGVAKLLLSDDDKEIIRDFAATN